jgi:16S rRNA (guanine966-N2)-methyltransferase
VTRIVAGAAGRRRLAVPPKGTRPTSERAREGLFSALEATGAVHGARVLDLYAGSGALGFEALSRGAARALFVESDAQAARTLRGNAAELRLSGAQVRLARVETLLAEPAEAFDLILADPPYRIDPGELDAVLGRLVTGGWCAPGGVLVVERDGRGRAPSWPAGLAKLRTQHYGDTALYWGSRE